VKITTAPGHDPKRPLSLNPTTDNPPAASFAPESEPPVSSPRKILTLHPPLGDETIDRILTSLETALVDAGASRIWVESESYPDLTVMATLPELQPEHAEIA
jgi:hypothetical protein